MTAIITGAICFAGGAVIGVFITALCVRSDEGEPIKQSQAYEEAMLRRN